MSAVVGLLRLDGAAANEASVRRVVSAMPHRCPDGAGSWAGGPVSLGHGMLHTTPESLSEELPVLSPDGRYALTAHARVDNRDELLPILGLQVSAPDSTVLLAAYARWGTGCLDRLVGDFAFAIWDTTERVLFLARDPLGANPLYYTYQPGQLLAFSSEARALLAFNEVTKALNEVRIADYLAGVSEDVESTVYEGVLRLPAGHTLTVQGGQPEIQRYYTLEPAADALGLSDEEYVVRFRELFVEAVRCRLRSAFRVGSQLSGGLDSSSVTTVARDLLSAEGGRELHTFSLVFPETTSADERPYIEAVIAGGGLIPHYIDGDALSPLGRVAEVYAALDDGLVGGTQHLVWGLLRAARDAGVRVVLDGLDGDTVVDHGLLRLKELARGGDWETLASEVRALSVRHRGADHVQGGEEELASPGAILSRFVLPVLDEHADNWHLRAFARGGAALERELGVPRAYLRRRYGKKLLLPPPVRRWRRRRRAKAVPPHTSYFQPDFAARTGIHQRMERLGTGQTLPMETVRGLQHALLASGKLQGAIELTGRLAALLGLEVRHPFMDRRLIEFALAMPPHLSLQNGWTRFILREALASYLPERIRRRVGKADMTPAVEGKLLERDRPLLMHALRPEGPLEAYVREGELVQRATGVDEMNAEDLTSLTKWAILSIWFDVSLSEHVSGILPLKTSSESPTPLTEGSAAGKT